MLKTAYICRRFEFAGFSTLMIPFHLRNAPIILWDWIIVILMVRFQYLAIKTTGKLVSESANYMHYNEGSVCCCLPLLVSGGGPSTD